MWIIFHQWLFTQVVPVAEGIPQKPDLLQDEDGGKTCPAVPFMMGFNSRQQ
jgi:hypothetical protein